MLKGLVYPTLLYSLRFSVHIWSYLQSRPPRALGRSHTEDSRIVKSWSRVYGDVPKMASLSLSRCGDIYRSQFGHHTKGSSSSYFLYLLRRVCALWCMI